MLRDRVQMNKQGFMVKKTDDDRTLAYGTYSAKEPPDYMPKMGQAGYWEPVYQTIIDLGGKRLFCLSGRINRRMCGGDCAVLLAAR